MIFGTYKYGRLIEEMRVTAGMQTLDESVCPREFMFDKINDAVLDYHRIMGLLDNPKYRERVQLTTSTTNDIISLEDLADYKLIKQITSIDEILVGPCHEKTEEEFAQIRKYAVDNPLSDYAKEICYNIKGSQIHFCKGARAVYATRYINYIRFPRVNRTYDFAAYVDILDEHKGMVIAHALLKIYPVIGKPVPPEVVQDAAPLNAAMQVKAGEEVKFDKKNA